MPDNEAKESAQKRNEDERGDDNNANNQFGRMLHDLTIPQESLQLCRVSKQGVTADDRNPPTSASGAPIEDQLTPPCRLSSVHMQFSLDVISAGR